MNNHANKTETPTDKWQCPKCKSTFRKKGDGVCPLGCTEKRETVQGLEKIPYKLVVVTDET